MQTPSFLQVDFNVLLAPRKNNQKKTKVRKTFLYAPS